MRDYRELTSDERTQLISQLSPEKRRVLRELTKVMYELTLFNVSEGAVQMTADLMRRTPPASARWN